MRKRKQSNRSVAFGFALTVIVLSGVALGLIFTRPSIQVVHLPEAVPEYTAVWARYVPSNALLFGYENYTSVRNYVAYPFFNSLLDIPELKLELAGSAMLGILTIALSTPNASVDIAFVNDQAFSDFSNAFSSLSYAAVREGNNSLYYVRNYANTTGFQFGWLAIIPSDKAIAFSIGSTAAEDGVIECLQVQQGLATSVISRLDVRQMLYLVNGTGGHLSLGLQDFPGVVKDGAITLTVVDSSGSSVQVRRVIEFNSSQAAVNDWTEVRSAYLNAHQFTVYDSYVEAVEVGSMSDITSYVRLVE